LQLFIFFHLLLFVARASACEIKPERSLLISVLLLLYLPFSFGGILVAESVPWPDDVGHLAVSFGELFFGSPERCLTGNVGHLAVKFGTTGPHPGTLSTWRTNFEPSSCMTNVSFKLQKPFPGREGFLFLHGK
jgi:hypothetical protein